MMGWTDRSLTSRLNDCILAFTISAGVISMSLLMALIFYDDQEWMGCVLSLVMASLPVYVMLHFSDVYDEIVNEIESLD